MQNQPNYNQQYPNQRADPYAPQPQQQPQQQGYYDESNLPLHLRRGAQFQRNAPRMPQTPQQQIPENMQQRYHEIERHYQDNPQTTEPAPKHSRFNLFAIITAVFFGVSVLGIIGAVMNFVYSRGNANLATSVSFLHAELAVLFIALILFCVSSIVRK